MNIDKAEVEHYGLYLKDKSRPPSRGGNKRPWHQHVITIGGERYSFLAQWSGKFVYSGETVSFAWDWGESGKYRNADCLSVVAWDQDGKPKRRGERGSKPWRTADTRLPARRGEWND
ncbi:MULTISPECIES: hypothetical protein [unclassified Mesorhizobium]|uniref:hypothetical protein n=1 Tax=unclassified Mesorhizobium TaxID=325217 RepID=UPI00112E45CC|nr:MULTISPECIES: hypothetical protein [unclassified Mesorhizobium]MBZ9810943.1 hypothetical protein [Mesorhizobium sp. ESP-6-2]TPM27732.1 hypothetical protein FJ955_17660 [Mesorhizobium sp. B2-2-2]